MLITVADTSDVRVSNPSVIQQQLLPASVWVSLSRTPATMWQLATSPTVGFAMSFNCEKIHSWLRQHTQLENTWHIAGVKWIFILFQRTVLRKNKQTKNKQSKKQPKNRSELQHYRTRTHEALPGLTTSRSTLVLWPHHLHPYLPPRAFKATDGQPLSPTGCAGIPAPHGPQRHKTRDRHKKRGRQDEGLSERPPVPQHSGYRGLRRVPARDARGSRLADDGCRGQPRRQAPQKRTAPGRTPGGRRAAVAPGLDPRRKERRPGLAPPAPPRPPWEGPAPRSLAHLRCPPLLALLPGPLPAAGPAAPPEAPLPRPPAATSALSANPRPPPRPAREGPDAAQAFWHSREWRHSGCARRPPLAAVRARHGGARTSWRRWAEGRAEVPSWRLPRAWRSYSVSELGRAPGVVVAEPRAALVCSSRCSTSTVWPRAAVPALAPKRSGGGRAVGLRRQSRAAFLRWLSRAVTAKPRPLGGRGVWVSQDVPCPLVAEGCSPQRVQSKRRSICFRDRQIKSRLKPVA